MTKNVCLANAVYLPCLIACALVEESFAIRKELGVVQVDSIFTLFASVDLDFLELYDWFGAFFLEDWF